jgi:3',5'-cyclic AMP phosphodiesterase CpdA
MNWMRLFAQISDTHLDGGERSLARTRLVMERLRGMPLEAILVTGDITEHGSVHEYEQAAAELVADVPVLVLPGNHDERSAFREVLLADASAEDGDAPVNTARSIGGVLFALCDSSIPGRPEGLLAPQTLEWLRSVLTGVDGPALVCLHHPPARTHQPLLDEILLTQAQDLAEVIQDHPQVVAVLCGHAHMPIASTFAGRPLVVAPGVVSTVRLPWTAFEQLTWDNALEPDEPPGVAFHVLDPDGRLTTHFRTAGRDGMPTLAGGRAEYRPPSAR